MSYRCYHLANMYLPAIHAGIQSAHAQHVFAEKYAFPIIDGKPATEQFKIYREWVVNHKVIVCLNGGMATHLEAIVNIMSHEQNSLPWVEWRESAEALNGAITNVAIVLPERIYANNQLVGRAAATVFQNPENDEDVVRVKTGRGDETLFLIKSKTSYASILMDRESGGNIIDKFTEFETHLMVTLSGLRLMS